MKEYEIYSHPTDDDIDAYLLKNGYGNVDSGRKRKKFLKEVIFVERVNLDFYELQRSNGTIDRDKFLALFQNSVSNIYDALYYLEEINLKKKFERKLLIRRFFGI